MTALGIDASICDANGVDLDHPHVDPERPVFDGGLHWCTRPDEHGEQHACSPSCGHTWSGDLRADFTRCGTVQDGEADEVEDCEADHLTRHVCFLVVMKGRTHGADPHRCRCGVAFHVGVA